MMASKEDCGETLKAEIRALRKKYGGFAVDFMNRVCQIEDRDSGDPAPESVDGNWNINWPDVEALAVLYTFDDSHVDHHDFTNGQSFNDDYQPDPTIFLWTINAVMAKKRELNRRFIINSTEPDWAKILTSNLSERNLSQIDFYVDSTSDETSLPIWARDSNVMFEVGTGWLKSLDERMYPIVTDLIRRNRVPELNLDGRSLQHLIPALASLKTMKHPALEIVEIIDDKEDMQFDWICILRSLSGLVSLRRLRLTIKSQSQTLDFFVDQFLSHPDCKVDNLYVNWKAEDVTIESHSKSVTLLEADYLLKILRNCPTIHHLNYYDTRLWKYELNVRQRMVSFFISLQQNQVGRGLVIDPSCYRTPSSHGIFSHLLDRAYNRMDTIKGDFNCIRYEEGVDHHHQDPPYDGIYYMIKELAGRGVLGIEGDVGEDDKSCTAGPSKRCKR